jgi:DNA-binding NtrC family response regulator
VAKVDSTVLITGESGSGKERIARLLHDESTRAAGPFIAVNCGAITETLLESELFGHTRGAFTGATADRPGLFEAANGGTLLLDEVGEVSAGMQVKLLRALQEREIRRVGENKDRRIDVRVLAATNRDLAQCVAGGSFRQDLYYRLNGVLLVIPPLRERVAEIEPLARTFMAEAAARSPRQRAPALSPQAVAALKAHTWPGNIRELRNCLERAVLLAGDVIRPEHLPFAPAAPAMARLRPPAAPHAVPAAPAPHPAPHPAPGDPEPVKVSVKRQMAALERREIILALARCAGNQTLAAELLGVSRRTLTNKLNQYDIPRPRKATRPRDPR